jgi:hypothetical protein
MVSALWIAFGLLVAIRALMTRQLTKTEMAVWAFFALVIAVFSVYLDHQDSVQLSALRRTVADTSSQLNDAKDQLASISKGQPGINGKIDAQTLKLLASRADTSPNAGANAVASAAANKIEELSKQVLALEAHTVTPAIPANVEAKIESSLRAAGPHPVFVTMLADNKNAVDSANEWVKILKAGGWLKPDDRPGIFSPTAAVPIGLSFKIKGRNIPDGLQIFGSILKQSNIPFNSDMTSDTGIRDENAFTLIVGANP